MKKYLSRLRSKLKPTTKHLSSLDAYARWANTYPAEAHNILMQIEQESMLSLMPDLTGKTVLDLACGTGRYGRIATQVGASTVIGVDNSIAMLQHGVLSNATCATTEAIPLPSASADVIICGLALGHLPDILSSFAEMSRILKPHGILLLSDFHAYQFLSGARRTFTDNGQTFEVEHYVHHISEYISTGQAHQLQLMTLAEPVYQESPVVVLFKFIKY